MKKIKIILIAGLIAYIGSSCESDKEHLVLDITKAIPSDLLTPADGIPIELTLETATDTFETFAWTKADYGPELSQEFTLQLDDNSTDFLEPEMLYRGIDLEYKMSNADLNLILYEMGASGVVSANFRVMIAIKKAAVDSLYSDPNNVQITMFEYNKPTLSTPINGTSYTLLKEDAENDFDEFNWDLVNYGGDYPDRYEVQIDVAGNNFVNFQKLGKVFGINDLTVKVAALNKVLVKLEPESINQSVEYEVRVMANSSDKHGTVYGEPITLSFKSYDKDAVIEPEVPPLYLIGSATLAGWVNTAGIEIIWDEANQEYSAITPFIAGGMKILEVSGQWAPQWGDDGTHTGILSYRPTETDTDPAEITSPGVGLYKIKVDIENLTYSFEAQ